MMMMSLETKTIEIMVNAEMPFEAFGFDSTTITSTHDPFHRIHFHDDLFVNSITHFP